MDWSEIKYFKPSEFDSPDFPESGEMNMSLEFVKKLDLIRENLGVPLQITSGFRTFAHNKRIGGNPNSAHLRGFAADIFVGENSGLRFKLIKMAILIGIKRFEDAPVHVHLDDDLSLPQEVIVFLPSYHSISNTKIDKEI